MLDVKGSIYSMSFFFQLANLDDKFYSSEDLKTFAMYGDGQFLIHP